MYKKPCITIFLFLFIIYPVMAITSTGTMDIANAPVLVGLITTVQDGNELTVRIRVRDANGYTDIEKVEFSVLFDGEVYLDNQEASFDSAQEADALYTSTFSMEGADEGEYEVQVRASDGETSAERNAKYTFSEQTTPTGAFTQTAAGQGLISRFFSWIGRFFS